MRIDGLDYILGSSGRARHCRQHLIIQPEAPPSSSSFIYVLVRFFFAASPRPIDRIEAIITHVCAGGFRLRARAAPVNSRDSKRERRLLSLSLGYLPETLLLAMARSDIVEGDATVAFLYERRRGLWLIMKELIAVGLR